MNDSQILTLAIAIILPLSMLIFSNSRISEAKETLRTEIGESKQTLRMETETLRAEMALGFERVSNKIDYLAGEFATLKELLSAHMREHR